jgi:hypothetical protein
MPEELHYATHQGEWKVYQNDKNDYGCPLYDQSGSMAVRDFDAIVAQLSPELRATFEAERVARQVEIAWFRATRVFIVHAQARQIAGHVEHLLAALILRPWLKRLQVR